MSLDALGNEKTDLTHILNSIRDGLFVVAEDGNLTTVNFAARRIFNVKSGIVGKGLLCLTSEKRLIKAIRDCAKDSKAALFELNLKGRTYLTTVKRLPHENLTMVVLTDVTETRENAKRREEFFANASHELKTPLTAIMGFCELAEINNKDNTIKKYLEGITRETNRMATLISHMLNISKLEQTEKTRPIPIELSEVISDVKETISPVIIEKCIYFEAKGNGIVMAEPEHLYEIVKNLAENAVRYTKPGGNVTIRVKQGKRRLHMTVSDTGIGISPEEQSKIFERFYRVEKSRSVQGGGTGLGLSIVKHICALYNWRLSLKSRLGAGTDVRVEFEDVLRDYSAVEENILFIKPPLSSHNS